MTVNFLSIIFTGHFLTHGQSNVSPNWHFSGALCILYAIKMNIFKRTDWLHYLNIKFNTQFCCIVCKTSWWWFLNFPFFRLFLLGSASSLIFPVLSSANFFAASCSLSCQYQCSSSKKVPNSVIQYNVSFAHIMWYPINPSRDTLRVKISTIDKECRFPLFDQIQDSILKKFQFKISGWSLLHLNNYFTNTYFQHFSNTNLTTTSPNFCHFGLTCNHMKFILVQIWQNTQKANLQYTYLDID